MNTHIFITHLWNCIIMHIYIQVLILTFTKCLGYGERDKISLGKNFESTGLLKRINP